MVMTIVAVALQPAMAGTAVEIGKEVDAAWEKHYARSPVTKDFLRSQREFLFFLMSISQWRPLGTCNRGISFSNIDPTMLGWSEQMVSSDWI